MSLTVLNRSDGEEAAMFGNDMIDLARQFADRLAQSGGDWIVKKTTVTEEIVYEAGNVGGEGGGVK
jgi:hypothetical protein